MCDITRANFERNYDQMIEAFTHASFIGMKRIQKLRLRLTYRRHYSLDIEQSQFMHLGPKISDVELAFPSAFRAWI